MISKIMERIDRMAICNLGKSNILIHHALDLEKGSIVNKIFMQLKTMVKVRMR